MPKLISFLIKNCVDLFGGNTLTLFDAFLTNNKENENKENYIDNETTVTTTTTTAIKLCEKNKDLNKDSGAEESDSLNSLNELNNNNNNNCKSSNIIKQPINTSNLFIKDHHYQPQSQSLTSSTSINTFSSTASFTSSSNDSSANSTPKIYQQQQQLNHNNHNEQVTIATNCLNNCSSNSTPSSILSATKHRLTTASSNVHQSYYVPMLNQHSVNKASLSNLSRDSGLTLSDTQLYSPEEEEDDEEDDYHHIINQHLHLSKKLNNIISDVKSLSNKNQFKLNSTNKKIATNSTSLKKKCSNKMSRLNTTSSEEDDLHDLEDVDIDDELSEKSCASENYNHHTPLYSRIYSKHNVSDHHHLTKSAPQLANIELISSSHLDSKQANKVVKDLNQTNQVACTTTTIPLYLHSIKNSSLTTNSITTNSSCNSPSSNVSSSNVSSTSLNLSSSNEYSASELQRNYFTSTPQQSHHLAPSNLVKGNNSIAFKSSKPPHIVTSVTISAKANSDSLQENLELNKLTPATICNVSIAPYHQKTNSQTVPPSYQETMNRKEINARIANLAQSSLNTSSTSRKISSSEIDNLISKKIYEESIRVYNADAHKNLTLRAVPVEVKSSDSDSDSDQIDGHPLKIASNSTIKITNNDQTNRLITRIKPIVQQRCAKDQTFKDVNWSVATLRNKFTELCKQQNELPNRNQQAAKQVKTSTCESTSSIYDLYKSEQAKDRVDKLYDDSGLSQSSQLLDNNCVTIIQIMHGQTRSSDSLSGEESYV